MFAHDLRTPLTRNAGALEKAYHGPRIGEDDQSLTAIRLPTSIRVADILVTGRGLRRSGPRPAGRVPNRESGRDRR